MTGNEEIVSVADDRYDTASIYGWLPIAVADDVSDAGVLPIRVHSDEVVLWRGESGQLHALNAYCGHLGHHLGYGGRVCGEDVRCFYHAWTWSPEGTNTDVPYDRRTYKGRRLGRWSVAERGGLAYIWHPGGGDKTTPGRPAPELDSGRGRFVVRSGVTADPRLIVEHLVDPITLGAFLQEHPRTSVVTSRTDSVFAIHHEFAEREPVDVEIHDAASVVLRTGAWSLLIGVCPVARSETQVWTGVEAVSSSEGAEFEQLERRINASVDRGLDLAARMAYVSVPHGPGADIVDTYRQWSLSQRIGDAGRPDRDTSNQA